MALPMNSVDDYHIYKLYVSGILKAEGRGFEGRRERECVCVCVCVCTAEEVSSVLTPFLKFKLIIEHLPK